MISYPGDMLYKRKEEVERKKRDEYFMRVTAGLKEEWMMMLLELIQELLVNGSARVCESVCVGNELWDCKALAQALPASLP